MSSVCVCEFSLMIFLLLLLLLFAAPALGKRETELYTQSAPASAERDQMPGLASRVTMATPHGGRNSIGCAAVCVEREEDDHQEALHTHRHTHTHTECRCQVGLEDERRVPFFRALAFGGRGRIRRFCSRARSRRGFRDRKTIPLCIV